jgi:hypothetical protein
VWLAVKLVVAADSTALFVTGLPSPQSIVTLWLSTVPGSDQPTVTVWRSPSLPVTESAEVIDGGTLLTTTSVVYSLKPPSLSMMRPLTV